MTRAETALTPRDMGIRRARVALCACPVMPRDYIDHNGKWLVRQAPDESDWRYFYEAEGEMARCDEARVAFAQAFTATILGALS